MAQVLHFLSSFCTSTVVFVYNFILLQILVLVWAVAGTATGGRRYTYTPPSLGEQIPAGTYRAAGNLFEHDSECAVCLSAYEDGDEVRTILKCKHTYHKNCLDMWVCSQKSSATCPLCRSSVLPESSVAGKKNGVDDDDEEFSDDEGFYMLYACFAW